MQLVEDVYNLVDDFPLNEKFSLSSQITRSAVSIPSDIAEGASRVSEKEFARYLEISLGSSFELENSISLQKRIYGLRKKIVNKN